MSPFMVLFYIILFFETSVKFSVKTACAKRKRYTLFGIYPGSLQTSIQATGAA